MLAQDAVAHLEQLDTAETLARFLNVSVACVRKYTITTDIPCLRVGRAGRFDRAAVVAWLQTRSDAKKAGER